MSIFNELFSLNLKTKIIVTVLLLFLGSIWTLTFFVSERLELDMTAQIEAQQFSTASYIANSIESQVKLRLESLVTIASSITPELMSSPGKLRGFLSQMVPFNHLFPNGVVVMSKEGKGIADYPMLPGRSAATFANREHFKEVIAWLKPAVGKPQIGRFHNEPYIAFAVPIFNRSGKLMGVMTASVLSSDPSLLGTVEAASYKGFRDWLTLVSPKYRIIITGSDPTRIMTPAPKTKANPLHNKFMAGFEGSGVSINSRGIRLLESAKQIPTPGWFIRVGLPTEMAFAPIKRMKIWAYSLALGLSILSSLLLWFVIRQALKPLYGASKLIQDITDKHLPLQKIPVTKYDEVGRLITSFNMHLDYRKQAEEAVRLSEQQLNSYFESAGDAIYVLKVDTGRILNCNLRACLDLGYSRDELVKLSATDRGFNLLSGDAVAIHGDLKPGEVKTIEGAQKRKDGSVFPVETRLSLLAPAQPELMIAIVRDITKRKRMEEELLRARNLESLYVLADGIAHDFNNLMAIVQGCVDLALTDLPPDHVSRQPLLAAMISIKQAKDLISRLITYSRNGDPHREVTDVAEIIRDAVNRTVKGTEVRLQLDLAENLWPAEVDELQMQQCFYNLISNSLEAMPEGGNLMIHVENARISAGEVFDLKEGSYLKVTFTDDGVGIPEDHFSKIFDPYFTTKKMPSQKGLGLGLSVCYSVLKNHDGHITVKSQPREGTSFVLYLPALLDLAKRKSS